jgi:hypothetical protein
VTADFPGVSPFRLGASPIFHSHADAETDAGATALDGLQLAVFSCAVQRNRRDCFSLERRGFFRGGGCGRLSSPRICTAIAWAIDTIQRRLGKTKNEV